ncbi:p21-activated protein kinase-interacting protein 1-like [Ixodes scapularis]
MATSKEPDNVFDVILGTYEEFVLGYSLEKQGKGKYSLRQTFTNHSHLGSVRCIAASGRFVASGSTDETVRLFNMRTRCEMGALMQHDGTIADVQFYKSSHLFSASEDKTICIWNTGSWQCLKTLRGHKADVTSLAVHPTGKLLLSVSKDRTLRTWNLVKGRNAYITNIKVAADFVDWSPAGDHFVVGLGKSLDVYSAEKAGKVHSIDFGKPLCCVAFLTNDVLVLGGDGGSVEVHNIKKKSVYHMFTAHSTRVKAAAVVNVSKKTLLVTAGSEGSVRVWKVNMKKLDNDPTLLCEAKCGCRITCMALHMPEVLEEKPRKKGKELAKADDGKKKAKSDDSSSGGADDGDDGADNEDEEADGSGDDEANENGEGYEEGSEVDDEESEDEADVEGNVDEQAGDESECEQSEEEEEEEVLEDETSSEEDQETKPPLPKRRKMAAR